MCRCDERIKTKFLVFHHTDTHMLVFCLPLAPHLYSGSSVSGTLPQRDLRHLRWNRCIPIRNCSGIWTWPLGRLRPTSGPYRWASPEARTGTFGSLQWLEPVPLGDSFQRSQRQTPLLSLSGTRKVVRTPTNPFEAADTAEVFVPKEIIAWRIQDIFAGPNKGRKADHYLVVWED